MGFRFRYFHLEDNVSTMKVGTDSMILGAWSQPPGNGVILDIGTGSGVLALMIGQKTHGLIEAVEIDEASCKQAKSNFKNSPWPERMTLFESDFQNFTQNRREYYDYIICNPPFFINSLKSPSRRKNLARHDKRLNYNELFFYSHLILKTGGLLSTVFPASAYKEALTNGKLNGMFPSRATAVYSKPGMPAIRYLTEWSKIPGIQTVESTLTIYREDGSFSEEYLELTKDYHIFNP